MIAIIIIIFSVRVPNVLDYDIMPCLIKIDQTDFDCLNLAFHS